MNNCDISCGLLMSININCNFIIYLYNEWKEGGELIFKGKAKEEEKMLNCFWEEFNKKAVYKFENRNININEELMYLLEEHIEEWEKFFIWKM